MLRSFRYEEIAEDLRQQIRREEYREQEGRLPSERILLQRYGVQRNTIRQALALLEAEGWITVEPKRGYFAVPSHSFPESHGTGTAAAPLLSVASPPVSVGETRSGAVLVVNAWNSASTALDSILRGLSQVLAGTALSLTRFDSQPRPGTVTATIPTPDYLAANQVAGVIMWPQSHADPEALRRLRAAVPLILVDRRILDFEADCVRFDDVAGGRLVTEHLLQQGHRRIGFLGDEAFAETVQQRWRGYTLALESAGIPADPAQVKLFHGIKDPPFSDYVRVLLDGGGEPLTAVVCSNDSTALLLLRFLRAEGRQVPEDVAVTGYGNLLPDYLDALELTTMAQPFEELGRVAGARLLERLAAAGNAASQTAYQQVKLPVHLIARRSSGAVRVGK